MKKLLSLATATLAVICLFASCGGQFEQNQPEQNQPEQSQPAHIHSFSEWETTKKPTCTTDGEQTRFCDCGEAQTKSVPATEHTIVIDSAVEATCTKTGLTEGKHCSSCNEVILAQSERPKLEHTYSGDFDATCEICGFTRKVDCNHSTMTVLPAKAATCTETGLTEGKLCSYCHTVFVEQEVIPTLEHDYNTAYSFDNSFHWYACKNCGTKKDNAEHKAADNGMCSVCEMPIGATEGIIYETSADGTYAMVVAYNGTAKKIRIADTYNGLPVTTINNKAFYNNVKIVSVIIPDSVTSIGDSAFYSCDDLKNIVIPDSVTSIGNSAFSNCYDLTSIVIPDSVTSIGGSAFYWCHGLTSIEFGEDSKLTSIGGSAFYHCINLTSIVIPDGVTSIGSAAFHECTGLTSIMIPDSVTYIGFEAFLNCNSLTDVYYTGTEAEWAKISIGSYNSYLTNATIHYNYVPAN